MTTNRTTDTALHDLFLHRWSPRAFDASDMPDHDLATIIDAARWAPSAMNLQPWRFLYAKRGDENWERFLSFLMPANRDWAQHSSVLFFIVSETMFNDKPSRTHSFDTGAAWGMMALQAHLLGYHSHGMAGVDFDAAAKSLGVPETFKIEAAVAIGTMGDPTKLPEALQAREVPSSRKARHEIAYAGNFRG